MPRFFFDTVADGDGIHDEVGLILDAREQVPRIAQEAVFSMAFDQRQALNEGRFTCVVRDEEGLTIYSAGLSLAGRWEAL